MRHMYEVAICTSENACRFPTVGSSIKHRPVSGRASADSLKEFYKLAVHSRQSTIPGRFSSNKNDDFKLNDLSGASPLCENAGWDMYGARPMSLYPH